jgi:alkanesulfonate monooxygenase SsuD/methylene tetrahydromethanopterin reductase-like flavin-dependent oxidoreductase (luciferase family)
MGNREAARAGLMLPTREFAICGDFAADPHLTLAAAAEEAGYDSVWAGDSPLGRARIDPLLLLAAVAARTKTIGIGTGVLIAGLRPPALLAYALACLDIIGGSRLVVGAGVGLADRAAADQHAALAIPPDQPRARMTDVLRICQQLWRAAAPQPVCSVFFDLPDDISLQPRPVTPGGPPIWIGGAGPLARRDTGTFFDGWMPYVPGPGEYAAGLDSVRGHAAAAGRPPDSLSAAFVPTVYLAKSRTEAREKLERYTRRYYGASVEDANKHRPGHFAGEPAEIADWLGGFHQAGADHLILRFGAFENIEGQLAMAADSLLPVIHEGFR